MQGFRPGAGERRRQLCHRQGIDPRRDRRKWRRQIDLDEHPVRLLQRRQRPVADRRRLACDPHQPRGDCAWHRHGAPALLAGREHDRAGQRHARRRRRLPPGGPTHRRGSDTARHLQPLPARHRSAGNHPRPVGRRPAARRDPQADLPQRQYPDPRRAHGSADGAGNGVAVRNPAPLQEARQNHHPDYPQVGRDHGHHRPGDSDARRRRHRRGRHRHHVERAIGQHDGRPADRRRSAARAVQAGRRRAQGRELAAERQAGGAFAGRRRLYLARRRDRGDRRRLRQRPERAARDFVGHALAQFGPGRDAGHTAAVRRPR